jgi:hypothetical protein
MEGNEENKEPGPRQIYTGSPLREFKTTDKKIIFKM